MNGDDRTRPVRRWCRRMFLLRLSIKPLFLLRTKAIPMGRSGRAVTERSEDDAVSTANSLGHRAVRTKRT